MVMKLAKSYVRWRKGKQRKLAEFQRDFSVALSRANRLPEVPSDLDILVVSPGGVATTFLLDHLSNYLKTNAIHDGDGVKHLPRPPQTRPKTIFVSGDPEMIFASIERRGWVARQGAKLGSLQAVLLKGKRQKRAFVAAVEAQYAAWRTETRDVLWLNYDELWNCKEEIAAFAGLENTAFVETFPPRRQRESVRA